MTAPTSNVEPSPPTLSSTDWLTWAVMAAALALVLALHLLPALLGGLAVYELVAMLSRWLRFGTLSSDRARTIAVALLGTVVVALLTIAGLGVATYFRHSSGSLPALLHKLADVIEGLRETLPAWITANLPPDAETLRLTLLNLLREHSGTLSIAGRDFGRGIAHTLIGMVLGALLALRGTTRQERDFRPLAVAGSRAAEHLTQAFHRVIFAQGWIALVNAGFTAVYLLLILPLIGVHLPLAKTIVALTLVVGLIPIVGNLISNTVIVLISLTDSLVIAAVSLLFLVLIHKLEYFLNARIIGSHIRAHAWELLIAMLVMEAAFGLAGLIAAPIYYAYFKGELMDRRLL